MNKNELDTDIVGIIIPTYNAASFVSKCIKSIRKKTKKVKYKIIVVDNASDEETKKILQKFLKSLKIDVLCYLDENRFWAEANNIGASVCPKSCNKFLLLNSDVKILDSLWLYKLLNIHKPGITCCGVVPKADHLGLPERGDGYCALVDREIYEKYLLDEKFPWWFGITKLQSQILKEDMSVQVVIDHNNIIEHYGGASVDKELPKYFLNIDPSESKNWFSGLYKRIEMIDII